MSRIGKKAVALPDNVKVAINGRDVVVESGKNKLTYKLTPRISVAHDTKSKTLVVTRNDESREARVMHGTTRATLANMVEGVSKGFSKELEVIGIGWVATVAGQKISLKVGFADTKEVTFPSHVKVEVNGAMIKISGADKQAVGQVAAEIRAKRKPEPYNGKGIKYTTETVVRKAGKAFAGAGAK